MLAIHEICTLKLYHKNQQNRSFNFRRKQPLLEYEQFCLRNLEDEPFSHKLDAVTLIAHLHYLTGYIAES
jgi:hypothetical protein